MMRRPSFRIVAAPELGDVVPALVERFTQTVNAGVTMEFMHQLSRRQGRDYWLSLRAELEAGSRLLVRLGYREAGVIPGWTLGPAGERYTHSRCTASSPLERALV